MKSLESEEVLVCLMYSITIHLESTLASQCLPERRQAFGAKTDALLCMMSPDVREKYVRSFCEHLLEIQIYCEKPL